MTQHSCDIAVIGAGIAGASLAAELGAHADVVVLEAEEQPGYHATGRSAAFWEQCYGGPGVVPLSLASFDFLQDGGFLSPRGALYIARDEDHPEIAAFEDRFAGSGVSYELLDRDALAQRIPGLRENWTCAIWQRDCADIDVAALHSHFLAEMRRHGVDLMLRARVGSITREGQGWLIETEAGETVACRTIVNAAGAWADHIAELAGLEGLGIQPLRRTVAQLRTDPAPPSEMPLTLDISGRFYFKPESGRLWLSPHDEEPCDPCDAAPEELAVATAIDRFQQVIDWRIEAVERRWAGLRSFSPDRLPVYGFDPRVDCFFWFAGQGGFGIQTAPAGARLGAQILLGLDRDAITARLNVKFYTPDRLIGVPA